MLFLHKKIMKREDKKNKLKKDLMSSPLLLGLHTWSSNLFIQNSYIQVTKVLPQIKWAWIKEENHVSTTDWWVATYLAKKYKNK